MNSLPKHLVVFRIGSMGDTVAALPCFHAIRQAFPSSKITLLTNYPVSSKAAPMVTVLGTESGFVNRVVNYSIGLRNPIAASRLLMQLRALKTSTLIYMRSEPTQRMIRRESMFFRLAGFRNLLCVPTNEDQRLPRVDPITKQLESEASRLARCFASIGPVNLSDQSFWDLRLTDVEQRVGAQLAATLPSPFLVINTGGKEPSKDWGLERWALFLQKFRERSGLNGLAIVGADDDHLRAETLLQYWGDGGVNLCGGPSPREVAALLAHAHLFVGHDSGPLHLAQCVGAPALGLFGSYNKPKLWHPLGSHVRVIHQMKGMDGISVDQVLKQALALIALS
ncbi:glycosyltransferase family 9 protein [Synechococcus sp. CBW1002]|uniref:glycosyltransferase family 9 protein n=1 Tax=Synechococcus sp. CBW1002 TaxID=1353134 RepID=UPI0018CEC05A|nr:glycosyltransferase family 9 protein [Synechococcus sp. CBW1002]QPN59140.1 glycosyltransferase family 9 protein [Synechococcus sp. CBW1002]